MAGHMLGLACRALLVAAAVSATLHGCASSGPFHVSQTRANMNSLELGMSKPGVISIVGRPRLREVFMDEDGKAVEVLFYQTEFVGMAMNPTEKDLTPVLIKEGKVIGWGRNFYETRLRLDVRVRD